jgi:hypothetical protein
MFFHLHFPFWYTYVMTMRKLFQSITLTGFVFGVLGFAYIAGNAWFHPQTLSWPLTHFLPYPREDTSGAIAFIVAMVSFFCYNLLNDDATPLSRRE